jgi:hypothetical protein
MVIENISKTALSKAKLGNISILWRYAFILLLWGANCMGRFAAVIPTL